jgi:hypothetical protein
MPAHIEGGFMILRTVSLAALAAMTFVHPVTAQVATDRAGEIKTWRDQCADPDIDLRTAYIEQAIATEDMAVMRVCLRQALESDDADIRNLGLRAALASIAQLNFEVTIPPELDKAYAEAKSNAKKLKEIDNYYVSNNYRVIKPGLIFMIDGADVSAGTSKWYPMAGLEALNDNYFGTTQVIGDKLTWVGKAYLQQSPCTLSVRLDAGAALTGSFQCGEQWAFPVTAQLL